MVFIFDCGAIKFYFKLIVNETRYR